MSGRRFTLHEGVGRGAWEPPYAVPSNEPAGIRLLQILSLDPSISRADGSVAVVSVPVEEKVRIGPDTQLFLVDLDDPESQRRYPGLDLEDLSLLRSGVGGRTPDAADPQFHAQMVYAVSLLTYELFRQALGRHPTWAFHGATPSTPAPLRLRPFAMRQLNAFYSRADRGISFGYKPPVERSASVAQRQTVFTSLSSDIVAHVVAHALLDGMRPYFDEPTNPFVDALHEAVADLVALFQRFTYTELVTVQLGKLRGRLTGPTLLRVIAPQLGEATGTGRALRTFEAFFESMHAGRHDPDVPEPQVMTLDKLSREDLERPHDVGRVLAEAVFAAFERVLSRKVEPIIELATEGRGVFQEGKIPPRLLDMIVHTTSRTASQFLTMCVRAIDYCPPVHVDFGDFLRALITADHELVHADPLGYREAIVVACMERGISPAYLNTPSVQSLVWARPRHQLARIDALALSEQNFLGDPAIPAGAGELERLARVFGQALTERPALWNELGLHEPDARFEQPEIASVRPSRRVGPDGQVSFDLIIEVVQAYPIPINGDEFMMRGGATVVLDHLGDIRFVVRKRVDQPGRRDECLEYLADPKRRALLHDRQLRELNRCCIAPQQRE